MFRYIMKRVLQAIPLLFVISFIVFSLIHIAPYDVIDSITTPNMTQEQIDLVAATLWIGSTISSAILSMDQKHPYRELGIFISIPEQYRSRISGQNP